jgi:hypothetical protein
MEPIRILWHTRGAYSYHDLRLLMLPYGGLFFMQRKGRGLARLSVPLVPPPSAYVKDENDEDLPLISLS